MKARKKILVAGIIATLLLSTMGIGVYAGTVGEDETVNLEKQQMNRCVRMDNTSTYHKTEAETDKALGRRQNSVLNL